MHRSGPLPAAARSSRAGFPAHLTLRAAALPAGTGLLSLAADAATKAWALSALRGGHRISLAGGLVRLQLVANHGAAFGIAAGYEPFIVAVSFAGLILLSLWALGAASAIERTGAALAAAGAAGLAVAPPAPPEPARRGHRRCERPYPLTLYPLTLTR